jgi:uncharacterized delta-60 repeat protein
MVAVGASLAASPPPPFDPTFHGGTPYTFNPDLSQFEAFFAGDVRDGRIVGGGTGASALAVALDGSGTPVVGFGPADGSARGTYGFSAIDSLRLDASGRAVIGGRTLDGDAFVARLTTVGDLDADFGSPPVVADLGTAGDSVTSLELDADGAVVGGVSSIYGIGGGAVVRLTSEGAVQPGFGTGGKVDFTQPVQDVAPMSGGRTLVLLRDPGVLRVARLTPDGMLDPSFGDHGIVAHPLPENAETATAVLQPDGALVVVGSTRPTPDPLTSRAFAARLTPDGALDAGFGEGGVVVLRALQLVNNSSALISDVALAPDGAIVLGGAHHLGVPLTVGSPLVALVVMLRPDGTLDRRLGGSGFATVDEAQRFAAVRVQPDGRIVGFGSRFWIYQTGPSMSIAIARLRLNPVDTTAPTLVVGGDRTVEATGAEGVQVRFGFVTSVEDDLDLAPEAACAPAAGSTFPLGTTTVVCTATDYSGNTTSGSFDISVVDTTGPSMSLPTPPVEDASGPAGANVTFEVTAHDHVDGALVPSCAPASGTLFPLGVSTVQCVVTDAEGNESLGSFPVTVADFSAPSVSVPDDMRVEATGPSGATVTFASSALDVVDGVVSPTCDRASGAVFPLGLTTVTCSAVDDAGNRGEATFDVVVTDSTPPTLTVPDPIAVDATSPAGANISFAVAATDIVTTSPAVTCSPASGSVFPAGGTTVECTAVDVAGNRRQASFSVHVRGADEQFDILRVLTTDAQLLRQLSRIEVPLAGTRRTCDELDRFARSAERQSEAELAQRARRIAGVLGCA